MHSPPQVKAPAPAATGARAEIANLADGRSSYSRAAPTRQRPARLSLNFGPRVVVEPSEHGGFHVTVRPILTRRDLERLFPVAWEALDYAEVVAADLGGRVLDRTGVAH